MKYVTEQTEPPYQSFILCTLSKAYAIASVSFNISSTKSRAKRIKQWLMIK